MDDSKPDIDSPEESAEQKSNQIDNEIGNEILDNVTDTEQQEALTQSHPDAQDYVEGDIVRQDKVENDHIITDRYVEHQQTINETEYAEVGDTSSLVLREESKADVPIIDPVDILSQLLVNDETGMATTPAGIPIPAAYIRGDVVFGDKISGNKIISAVYIEQQTIINRTLVDTIEGKPSDPGEPPYKGLQSFTEKDADLFFGREQLTAELVQRLVETDFLAVIGASGSGKSSVVRAGVVPMLSGQKQTNVVPEALTEEWMPYIFSPSQQPLQSLATALYPQQDEQQKLFSSQMLEDKTALLSALQSLSSSASVLLVIDQFEELFTLDTDSQSVLSAKIVTAFIDNVVTAVTSNENVNFKILITLRSDFYTDCLNFEVLHKLLERHQKIISPMNPDEMREAIIQPATKGKWKIQDGLVELFLEDVGEEPGRLPLLSHALLETWKRRRMRVMTLTGYQEAGGVKRAIAQTAETTYSNFTPNQQIRAKQIFKRLTALVGETHDVYTRRRVSWGELGRDEETQIVISELSYARLVTADDNTVEVAHEAVIREWKALRSWLDEDREDLIIHRRLTLAAQTWQEKERNKSFLYQGLRLDEAEEWATRNFKELNELEKEFFNESLVLRRKQRRQRVITVSIFLVVIIGGLLVLLLIQQNATRNISSALATTAAESNARATSESIAVVRQIEAEEAGTQEAIARLNTEARSQIMQGQAIYEESPLSGMYAVLEGINNSELAEKNQLLADNLAYFEQGRIFSLQDVENIYISPDETWYLVDYYTKPGEFRNLVSNKLIEELPYKVETVFMDSNSSVMVIDYEQSPILNDIPTQTPTPTFTPSPTPTPTNTPTPRPTLSSGGDTEMIVLASPPMVGTIRVTPATGFLVRTSGAQLKDTVDEPPVEIRTVGELDVLFTFDNKLVEKVYFDPQDRYLVFSYIFDKPQILNLQNLEVIDELGKFEQLVFSQTGDYLLVDYIGDPQDELFRWKDGNMLSITQFDFEVFRGYIVNDSIVILDYDFNEKRNGELLNIESPYLVYELKENIDEVYISPTNETFVISYIRDTTSDLFRTSDVENPYIMQKSVGNVFFSSSNESMVVYYDDNSTELRFLNAIDEKIELEFRANLRSTPLKATYFIDEFASSQLLIWEDGSAYKSYIYQMDVGTLFKNDIYRYYPSNSEDLLFLEYFQTTAELWNIDTNELILDFKQESLPDKQVYFSSDESWFIFPNINSHDELWSIPKQKILLDLGAGIRSHQFLEESNRLFVWYEGGDAHLIDMDWLQVIDSMNSPTFDEFKTIFCEELFIRIDPDMTSDLGESVCR